MVRNEVVTDGQEIQVVLDVFCDYVGKLALHNWRRISPIIFKGDLEIRKCVGEG